MITTIIRENAVDDETGFRNYLTSDHAKMCHTIYNAGHKVSMISNTFAVPS